MTSIHLDLKLIKNGNWIKKNLLTSLWLSEKNVFMQSLNSIEPPPHPPKGKHYENNYTHKRSNKNALVAENFSNRMCH